MPVKRIKSIMERRAVKSAAKVTRFVLLVGDEGAILLHIVNGKVKSRQFSPEPNAPETQAFYETTKDNPRTPLIIIFDTIDQAYIQQSLPPVTSISINKLIKRRLERDFSDDYLKAALPLGKEKEGRKDWLFVMVALQRTGIVKSWLDLVAEWPCRALGMYMLPVEATAVLQRLNAHLSPREEEQALWQFMISYNRVSGIRQIVCKNGALTLTRLGQPALESNPEAIAGTIEQEIIGTKEYLKRLGFDDKDRLNIIVIVAEDIRRHIDVKKLRADKADIITPHEAAGHLKLVDATQPSDRYGDVVLSAAIGTSPRQLLKLITPELIQLTYYYLGLLVGRVGTVLLLLGLLLSSGYSGYNIVSMSQEITKFKAEYARKQAELAGLKEKAAKLTSEDLEQVVDTFTVYETLLAQSFSPEEVLLIVSNTLGQDIRVSNMSWMVDDKPAAPGSANQSRATIGLTIDFPMALATDRDKLMQLSTDTLNNLKVALPGYEVSYQSIPSLISDREQMDINLSGSAPKPQETDIAKSLEARVQIIGPVNAPAPAAAPAAVPPSVPANVGGANATK